ncbi:MAG: nucleotidyltransferase family protein [Bacteroidota bacterium]
MASTPSCTIPLSNHPNIVVLIAAAGTSSRMGKPKQLLPWGKTHLLGHCLITVHTLEGVNSVTVLGAHFDQISERIADLPTTILHHQQWEQGLGSSISFGIQYIRNHYATVGGVLILLADQPLLTKEFLTELIDRFEPGNEGIVATRYPDGHLGVPALFDVCYFDALSQLSQDRGAKSLIRAHPEKVDVVEGTHHVVDLDTEEDYLRWYRANHQS